MQSIMNILNARTASRLGTVNRTSRNAARHRMKSRQAQKTKVVHQAARIGRVRYKANKKSQNLNRIYDSLNRMGIVNHASWYRNQMNNFIRLYGNLKNSSLTKAEHERLLRKMKKWKGELVNEIQKRNNQKRQLRNFNLASQGSMNHNW